jgi:hypothetical protein
MAPTPSAPPQTYFQFLKKFIKWGSRDLRRYYQPLQYVETKGPLYYKPLGYDDRPVYQKLLDKYFYIRTLDHIICGLISYVYDNKQYLHERFPLYIQPMKYPIESYLPRLPKRFSHEFIEKERERMNRLKLPASDVYEEFSERYKAKEDEQEKGQSIADLGKMFGTRMFNKISPKASQAYSEIEKQIPKSVDEVLSTERQDAIKAALGQGQDIAKLAMRGDVKAAATEVKDIFNASVRDNQALKDVAKDKASSMQEIVHSFIKGYDEGKKYEEIHHTNPRELFLKMQENARKAVFIVARDVPDVLKSDADMKSKLNDLFNKTKDLENTKITPEDERQLKEAATLWLSQKGHDLQLMKDQAAEEFFNTPEGKVVLAKMEEATKAAETAKAKSQVMLDKAKEQTDTIIERAKTHETEVRTRINTTIQTAKEQFENQIKKDK